jgi:superfamily II DNA or RNA helicase
MASRIDTLISKCRSWDEFVELVNALPKTKNKEKGDLFERLTHVYLQTQPTYRSKLKNVYLLSDKTIPERLRTKLNLPDNDEGIDLVCETYSGEYWSVQCKYKSDQSAALTYKELSTFNSLSFNACTGISLGLVAHTSTKPVKKSHLMPMVNEIGLEKWLEISDADWKQIISVCRSNTLKPPKKRSPRRHQKAAIADAHNHFVTKKQKRGKLIMPCGTGKSLTAYWIAQALEAKTIVVAVPSLALVRQSLADWTAEYLAEGVIPEWLAVCSDHSVGSMGDADSTVATAYEMGIPTNPSGEELDNFLTKRSKAPKIVFTTYQSAEKLCDASRRNNKTFDLLIADEAHKTVGRKSKSFATLLFDENIKVKRRLFMTATERVYNANRDDVISMDDPDIYGSTCHQLSFKEAIKQKIICDYKIVTIAVSDAEISELIKEKAELAVSAGNKTIETDAHSLAAGIAMQKAFEKYGIKHAVTFHSSIKRADNFKSQQEDLPNNTNVSHSHISSKLTAGQRAALLKRFAEEDRSLITNARCLTEGVDIKAIDCVAFVDPKQSAVDIVQAAGRAMRLSKETGKVCGYIILPIEVSKGSTLENFKKSPNYSQILRIITSLSTQDERIQEQIKRLARTRKRSKTDIVVAAESIAEVLELDIDEATSSLTIDLWQNIGRANWVPFDVAREYARSKNLTGSSGWYQHVKDENFPPDVPKAPANAYKHQGWSGFADWLGTNRLHLGEEYWSYEKAKKFVQQLKLKNAEAWQEYSKSLARPRWLPASPANVYRGKGWVGTADWIGVKNAARGYKDWPPFEQAREFTQKLGLKNAQQWREYTKSPDFADFLPTAPEQIYEKSGWKGYGDWLGTGYIGTGSRQYRHFWEARKYARSLGLNGSSEWRAFTKTAAFPADIPVGPERIYKNKGWKGFSDWLGTVNKHRSEYEWRSFEEARKFARKLGLKQEKGWRKYASSGKRPDDIPYSPAVVYKGKGWQGFEDFLGYKHDSRFEWRPFNEARAFVHTLGLKGFRGWRKYAASSARPSDIPSAPENHYRGQGWAGHSDWTGYEPKSRKRK